LPQAQVEVFTPLLKDSTSSPYMLDYATYPAITSAGDALSGSCVRGMPFELNSFVTPNLVAH
jgi:hypothetical protein